jgi:DNA-binding Xre family transcriptional regulator
MPTRFRLAEVLEERGTSQRQLAKRSGITLVTINRICGNLTAGVTLATLDAIAAALGVEPGELIVREPKRARRSS